MQRLETKTSIETLPQGADDCASSLVQDLDSIIALIRDCYLTILQHLHIEWGVKSAPATPT